MKERLYEQVFDLANRMSLQAYESNFVFSPRPPVSPITQEWVAISVHLLGFGVAWGDGFPKKWREDKTVTLHLMRV